MGPKNRMWVIAVLLVAALAATNFGCGSGSSAPPPPISVSLSSTSATVEVGATAQFTATVSNDPANKGVNWTVSCSAQPCGSVSAASTASGAPTTYTPPNSQTGSLTVSLTATSVSDASKLQTAVITVPAVAVNLSPTSATVQLGAQAPFSATVNNDGGKAGVKWTVSCSQSACGGVSPANTASGGTATYTAPTAPPAGSLSVTLTATSVTDSAVVGTATITVPGIAISVSPNNPSVQSGGTQQFSAIVTGDPSNGGVTWQVVSAHRNCNPINHRCGSVFYLPCSSCGTVSPSNTASGVATTYTAPGTAPPWAGLQAISVTNTGASVVDRVIVQPISVSVSSAAASVMLKASATFSATVANDATNKGVMWALMQNGVACAPGCGTISPTSTAAATYTAPSAASTLPLVTITATSAEDPTKSGQAATTLTTSTGAAACGAGSGGESLLKGQYAYLLHGTDQNSFPILAGSFTADGTGKVTGGERDSFTIITGGQAGETDAAINAAGSAYGVGPDHRGCLALTMADGRIESYRFSLGSINSSNIAASGHIIEFGDAVASGDACAGTLRLQDPTSFSAGQFKGDYAFGVYGSSYSAMIGVLTSDGVSALSSVDLDAGALSLTNSTFTPGGTFTCCSVNGRGTMVLQYNGVSSPFYMINSGDAFLLTIASGFGSGGEAIGIPPGTAFTQGSLNGAAVLRETRANPLARLATVNGDGKQSVTVNDFLNNQGTFSTSTSVLTYQVASNGRVVLAGGNGPVIYLYGQNQGFVAESNTIFGVLEPQTGEPFSGSSFSGAYLLGTENPGDAPEVNGDTLQSGVVAADGSGNAAGLVDQSSPAGLAQNQSLNFTYSIAADGTGNVGSGTTAIMISPNKLAYFNNTDPNPTITVVEK